MNDSTEETETMPEDDAKEFVTFDEAVALLPLEDRVHTVRGTGMIRLGADWDRAELLSALQNAPHIEISGPNAQATNHGLVIQDSGGYLFIETCPNAMASRKSATPAPTPPSVPLERVEALVKALERIENPIKAFQAELEPGCVLNWAMASTLSESHLYLKNVAREALEKFKAEQEAR